MGNDSEANSAGLATPWSAIEGKAVFTQDLHLPGVLTAVVAHPSRFGANVRSIDGSKAKAVKGVVEVVRIPTARPSNGL